MVMDSMTTPDALPADETLVPVATSSERERAFQERLRQGQEIERQVGHDLFDLGYWVMWPNPLPQPGRERPFSPSHPDLVVLLPACEIGLEIKSRRTDFAGPDDFPFELAFVGATARWNTREDDPWGVVIVSRGPKRGRIVIPCRTRHQWRPVGPGGRILGAPRHCWHTWEWLLDWLQHPTT